MYFSRKNKLVGKEASLLLQQNLRVNFRHSALMQITLNLLIFGWILIHNVIDALSSLRIKSSSSRKGVSYFLPLKFSSNDVEPNISEEKAIIITPNAMNHLQSLQDKVGGGKCFRMGVKAGGCSGMSYVMDFIPNEQISDDDYTEEFGGIKCVMDPKSMLYLYGLQLDYSDELIGGGFKFSNPNAETSCGCGKSFGV